MKKILKYLVVSCLALLVGGLITACGESHTPDDSSTDLPTLSTPKNVEADFWKLTWDEVEGATGYVIRLPDLDSEFETMETSFSLFEYFAPDEEYYIDVKAIGDGATYEDSEWASIEYATEPVTEGLNYTRLEDGTYEVYCKVANIPKDGRLVLPDKYNSRYVTRFAPQKVFGITLEYTDVVAIRLPAQLKEIENAALYRSSISETYFPESLEYVGGEVFYENMNLKSVTLPKNLKEMGGGAFYGCTSLTEVSAPDHLDGMGRNVFLNTPWYENHPDGLFYFASALCGYKGKMPENTVLDSFPSFVTVIADGAFENRTELAGITIPEGVAIIPGYTFADCKNLKTVVLPDSVKEIIGAAFYKCESLTEISLPKNLKAIYASAFNGSGLHHIEIPDGTTTIGAYAFENCKNLKSISIPDSVTEIDRTAFGNCGLETITLPKDITVMPFFSGCENLTSIVFGDKVKTISFSSLSFNEKLTSLYYMGSETQWNEVTIERYVGAFGIDNWQEYLKNWEENLTVYFYSETPPEDEGNYWHYAEDGKTPVVWK